VVELLFLCWEYDVDFRPVHFPGKLNVRADALSRQLWELWDAAMSEMYAMDETRWKNLQFWSPPTAEARKIDKLWFERQAMVEATGALCGFAGGAKCLPNL
jgi:hypothetical protein